MRSNTTERLHLDYYTLRSRKESIESVLDWSSVGKGPLRAELRGVSREPSHPGTDSSNSYFFPFSSKDIFSTETREGRGEGEGERERDRD